MAAEGTELGVGWVSVLPDMSQLAGKVSSGFTSAAKGASKAFTGGLKGTLGNDLKKSFGDAGKEAGLNMAKAALSAARSDLNKLGKLAGAAADKQADALGRLRVAEARLADALSKSGVSAARLAQAEESVAAARRKSESATKSATSAAEKLTKAQTAEKDAAQALTKAQDQAADATGRGAKSGNAFTRAFKGGFKPADAAREQFNKIDGDTEGRRLASRFGAGFSGGFAGVAKKSAVLLAATLATVGVGSFVKDSVGLEASFSQTMNTMAAAAKVPASGIKELSDLALKLGADTTFSAGEAATAMLELAKGGLDAATIKSGALAGTLTLAAAGGTSLEVAATIASNALNTFSLKGSDMASVAAALAGGANASSASVESLGQALQQVGPGASTAGLSLQETVAVLSSFDAAGIKGSDAGTSLKTMLTRLIPTTDKAKGFMEDLGISFVDANDNILPITQIAQILQDKLSGMSDAARTTALSTIFGSDATRAATVLMKEGAAGVQQFINATNDQNAANEVAAARMSGTAGAIESFKGSLETAKLRLGQFIAPAVQAGLGFLTDKINKIGPAFESISSAIGGSGVFKEVTGGIQALVSSFKAGDGDITSSGFAGAMERIGNSARLVFNGIKDDVIPFIVGFATNLKNDLAPPAEAVGKILAGLAVIVLSSVGPAFKGITGFIKENSTLFQALAVGVGAIVLAMKAYQVALATTALVGKGVLLFTKAWTVAQAAFNFVMNLNPISIVVLALIGLAAGLVYAYKHSEKFRNVVNTAFDAVKSTASAVFGAIKTAIEAVVTAFFAVKNAISTAIDAIVGAFNAVKSAVSTAIAFVAAVFSTIIDAVMVPVNAVIGVLESVWSRIEPILVLPFYIAKAGIDAVWNLIKAGFNTVKNWVVNTFTKAWNAVSGYLSGPIDAAKARIDFVWNLIKAGFNAAKNWVVNTFTKAWAATKNAILVPVQLAKDGLDKVWAAIKTGFTTVKDWVTGAFSRAWAAIKDKLTKPVDDAKSAITTALGAGKNGLQWAFSRAVTGIGKIWDGLKELAKAPIRFIVNTVLNDGLIDGFNWIAGKFKAPTITRIPLPAGFADGGHFSGRLPGKPSAVDNMLGMTSKGAVGLATGEFITNAKDTARTLPLLKHINNGGDIPGFADGGLFGKLKGIATGAFSAGKSFGSDVLDVLKDPVKWFKGKMTGPLNRMSELGNSPAVEIVKAVPRHIADTVANKAKELLGLGDIAAASGPPITGGRQGAYGGVKPWVAAAGDLIRRTFRVSSIGGVGGRGNVSDHPSGHALDFMVGSNKSQGDAIAGYMMKMRNQLRLTYLIWYDKIASASRGWKWRPYTHPNGRTSNPTLRHLDHVHASFQRNVPGYADGGLLGKRKDSPMWDGHANGGVVKSVIPQIPIWDRGGVARPGLNLINNMTGSDEELRPVKDKPAVFHLYDTDGKLIGSMKGIARKVNQETAATLAHEFQI